MLAIALEMCDFRVKGLQAGITEWCQHGVCDVFPCWSCCFIVMLLMVMMMTTSFIVVLITVVLITTCVTNSIIIASVAASP